MGDLRRNDLMLLFSLAAIPMAGCSAGVEDGGGTVFSPTVGNASQGGSQTAGDDETGGDDEDSGETGGGDDGSASGPNGTTITTAADTGGGDPSTVSITNPSTDPTNASMTYGGTYGGTYGATYGGTYGSYGGSYGDGGGMVPPECQQFVSNYIDCIPEAARYEEQIAYYCAGDLMYAAMAGGPCGSAIEEYYACMSMADCAEINGADPCGQSQVNAACGG